MDYRDLDALADMVSADLGADLGSNDEKHESLVFQLTSQEAVNFFLLVAEQLGHASAMGTARVLGSTRRCEEYEAWLQRTYDTVIARAAAYGWRPEHDE
jgi:hypothetical protein